MERITLNEFIEDLKESRPILSDGLLLGLIIDESNGETELLSNAVLEIERRTSCVSVPIDALSRPSETANAIAAANGGDTLVLLHADRPLLPEDYKQLNSLVSQHALEEWHNNGSERNMVRFHDASRFVLVLTREVFETTLKRFPPIPGILGASLSLDTVFKMEVA